MPDAGTTPLSRFVTTALVVVMTTGTTLWWTRHSAPAATTAPLTASVAAPEPAPSPVEPAAPPETPLTTEFARLAPTTAEESDVRPASTTAPEARALEDVVSDVLPAVVSITAGQARGTGFFIKTDTVLTNAHVVEGHSVVQLSGAGTTSTARVASINPSIDIAVLQVATPDPRQRTLRLGSADGVRIGEEVVAVGSALGVLSNTVTRGIVSAVRRAGDVTLIQTDAAINPGNSGGPLVNRSGQVIGVNSIGVSRQTAEGVAFAVAIDHASPLATGGAAAVTPSGPQTPLTSLQQQMSGRPSDSDAERDRGEKTYADAMLAASRAADSIDDFWNRYSRECLVRASSSGERPWFAALESNAVEVGQSQTWNCSDWVETVRKHAGELRARVQQASEAARQNGVYPGAAREIRRRYKLDWSGW